MGDVTVQVLLLVSSIFLMLCHKMQPSNYLCKSTISSGRSIISFEFLTRFCNAIIGAIYHQALPYFVTGFSFYKIGLKIDLPLTIKIRFRPESGLHAYRYTYSSLISSHLFCSAEHLSCSIFAI